MNPMKPATLALAIVSTLALVGCPKQEKPDQPSTATTAPAAPAMTLDESKLPAVIHFAPTDLDTTKNACSDFGGYVNDKWLAANPIPGDRSSWGAFDALAERYGFPSREHVI